MAEAARVLKSALGQVSASQKEPEEPEKNTPFKAAGLALFCWHAPNPAPFGEGRQWFRDMGWTFRDAEGIARSAALIEATLEHISQTHGIARQKMALMGFSQGSMTSLYTLPQLSVPPAAVVSLCGGLTVEPAIGAKTPTTTPLLFIHGLADDVWPADVTVKAEAFYRNHGYSTQLELVEGLGHGIDGTVLAHTTMFLAHTLAKS